MVDNDVEFEAEYPSFAGLANEFCDPPDDPDVEEIARNIRKEWGGEDRIKIFEELLRDSARILGDLDASWDALGVYLHNRFHDREQARKWLLTVQRVWTQELERLKRS